MKNNGWQRAKQILLRYAIPLALGIGLIIYLKVVSRDEPSALLENASFLIASIAVIVAVICALLARRSLEKTEAALELTSNTTRPFIALQPGTIPVTQTGNEVTLQLEIKNTGAMPGNDVNADIGFFDEDEEITEDNLSKKYPAETQRLPYLIMFPNTVCGITYTFDLLQETATELLENIKKGKVRFRLRIMYTSLGRKHITIQTEQMGKMSEEMRLLQRSPVPPQKWE